MEVTYALAEQMLTLAGLTDQDPREAIADGRAYAAYQQMIRAQGGDPDARLPEPKHTQNALIAAQDGWLTGLDALQVGVAAWRLGAGRERKEDPVSAAAGIICLVKPGEKVTRGQPILELRTDEKSRFDIATQALDGAATISDHQPPRPAPLVIEHIG
jgi:thymidine phosphorylase